MQANHARIVQGIESKYSTAANPMTHEADSFLTKLKAVFDRIPLDIAEGPARNAYTQCALEIGRTGLQLGNLNIANQQLDELNQVWKAQYYAVDLDDKRVFTMVDQPWAPKPMPEDVIAFANRVERRTNKVKRLLPNHQQKQDWYLRTLMGYARQGLEKGDIKNANAGLERFEAQFVDEEGPVFRSEYVSSTLWTAIYTFIVAFVLGIAYTYAASSASWPDFAIFFKVDENFIPAVLSVVIGICLGISFFAFVRNLNLTFDSLGRPSQPKLRASFFARRHHCYDSLYCAESWAHQV